MKSSTLRQTFLNYFKERGHEIVPSSSLVPIDDPTLLFTNAGMVPFKDVFLGISKRPYTRAASSQRCVRAGGKHNDLENVGYTTRHHTFFEMLGNFSFGDYFKKEAIEYAWDFLTNVLKLPQEKLWVTVFEEDIEAENIWLKDIKIDSKRFSRCGEKDNFWSMGDTGPCGPCSEIFYDHGPDIAGGPPGSPDEEGDRYIEIWNLVFMQYNRDASGKIIPLPKPSVDTGMGLERIAAVLQGVHNNYEIDLFQNLIKVIAKLARTSDLTQTSLRVIADHIRSTAFLIADGIMPDNEGRGYVLRRIIRRAIRHGNKLGIKEAFFYKMVVPLVIEMGEAYPLLSKQQTFIEKTILREEEVFASTLEQGLKIFNDEIKTLKTKVIPGEVVFKLYDTYGFPLDLTADIARERNLVIDENGFHQYMQIARDRSQRASKFAADYPIQMSDQQTHFMGYEATEEQVEVTLVLENGKKISELTPRQKGAIVLNRTPFYAESGGQIGDKGVLEGDNSLFEIYDTQKQGNAILHFGHVIKGSIKAGDKLQAKVDKSKRMATAYNHSATHLLNAALRELLGEHVLQKGSLVEEKRLRFDFSHFEALTAKQLQQIEQLVNEKIRANLKVETKIMTPEEAMDSGAIALAGETYGEEVRVLIMGDFSMELCGGTHVSRTGDIGIFKIISETGIAAGIRRIEAVTGDYALQWLNDRQWQLKQIAKALKTTPENVTEKIQNLIQDNKELQKHINQLKAKLAGSIGDDLIKQAKTINNYQVIAEKIENADVKALRDILDKLKQKLTHAIIVLTCIQDEKVYIIAGVNKAITDKFKAGELVNFIAEQVGGKGGGRDDMAQAGGNQPQNLTKALESVFAWVKEKI